MPGIETLPEQVPVDASKDGRVAQREPVTQPAVERLLEECIFIELREDFGYRVPGDVAVDPKRFDLTDDTRATAVFRIFQEALTNVVRHAGADSVYVTLRATADELALEVRDDGRGITAAQLSDQGALGLLGMRERAEAVGGVLEVFAGATEGTTVVLRLPVGARAPAEDV